MEAVAAGVEEVALAVAEVAVVVAEVIKAVVTESAQEAADLAVVAHTVGAEIRLVAAAEVGAEILTAAGTFTAKMGIMGAETIMTTEVDTETARGTVMAADTVLVTGTEASWPFSSDSMDGISRRWF
jgi:hypothetical protein